MKFPAIVFFPCEGDPQLQELQLRFELSKDQLDAISRIKGVVAFTNTDRYGYLLRKGRLFDWQEILPLIYEVLNNRVNDN